MKRPAASPLLLLVSLLAACGGKSCSCLAPIPGGFPTDSRRHENAMQVRATASALQYLQQNAATLVGAVLPSGSNVAVPPSCGAMNEICCLNGMPQMCQIAIDIQNLVLTPTPPSTLSFTVTTKLKSAAPIPININQLITAQCYFAIDTDMGTAGHNAVDISSDITFTVDPQTDLTNIALANSKVANLDPSMLTITAQSGLGNAIACGTLNLGFIKGLIIGSLGTTLGNQLSSTAENAFCAKCTSQNDCDSFADSCKGGSCQRGMSCLQEIGAAGRLDVGGLLGKYSRGQAAKMDILALLGGYADVTPAPAGGLSLGLLGGAEGGPHDPCVPMRPAPDVPMVGKWQQYLGEAEPRAGMDYHFAIGVHQSHINTLAWGAFDGGALCLNVGTPAVPQLDSTTLGLVLRSLDDLVHGKDSPVFLAVRPQQEPEITLGAGTFDVDATGKKTIKDPLLHVSIPKLSIDFYAFVDERYVRVMTLTADATLPVALDIDDQGRIVPMLGDLNQAFANTVVTNSELLAEAPDKLAKSFPMLLALAAGQLGSIPPVTLPKIMGLQAKLVAIEPTDDDAGNPTFLSIFAALTSGTMDAFHAGTGLEVARVEAPPTEAFAVEYMDPATAPRVVLELDGRGYAGDASDLE
jgi:hypothetical protein